MSGQRTPADRQLIDNVSARQLAHFRNYVFSSAYIISHAERFLYLDWIDPVALRNFLGSEPSVVDDQNSADAWGDVSARQLMDFRNYMFSPAYIKANASRFLEPGWIDSSALRGFLGSQISEVNSAHRSNAGTTALAHSIKIEPTSTLVVPLASTVFVKQEPVLRPVIHEVIEISSDSDSGDDSDVEVTAALTRGASRSSSVAFPDGIDFGDTAELTGRASQAASLEKMDLSDDDSDLIESDTRWEDGFTSLARIGKFRVTKKVTVKRIEYLPDLASVYPIFRTPTAVVIDLSDPKHQLTDPRTNDLYLLDSLVRNADNDTWSWSAGSGAGNSTADGSFAPGEEPITCRRATADCRGVFTCTNIDPALLKVTRFDLDPSSRNAVLAAQAETRRKDGTTSEHNVALFKQSVVLQMKCEAIDSNGKKCQGAPIVKAKSQTSRGHEHFMGCSGWTRKFNKDHQYHPIPDNVDENLLAKALARLPFSDDASTDTPPCTKFVAGSTGLRQTFCPHPHIVNGVAVRSRIVRHPCNTKRSIYVPSDLSIRKVLIVTNGVGHNHPMPILSKIPVAAQEKYKECLRAVGGVGATVSKVDNAPSTKQLLGGKTPAGFAPGLHSKPAKAKIIAKIKRQLFPNGTDAAGVFKFYLDGLTKPLPEHYIHSYLTTPDGGICILTCVPYLLKLLDDPGVRAFDDDTTYKRVEGKMNEWELTLFAQIVARAASVVRAYINRGSTDFFEMVCDELQRVKLLVTSKPIPLKAFVPGGNLEIMNSDMDGAQIPGICRSVMKHNVPEYSGIPNDTPPEQVAQYFVKICWRHAKEPVHDFKSLVSPADYARLLNFVYIKTKEELAEFSAFVRGLGIKKILDWWLHKEMHPWIIPSLVKSESRISAEVWDTTPSTTNTNEGQHAWTNALTGTGRSLAEAITTAHEVDSTVAAEIELTLKTGILVNPQNEVSHRMSRNSTRQATRARKARESQEVSDVTKEIQSELADELERRRESNARSKELQEQLRALKGKGVNKSSAPKLLSASSSGRVKSGRTRPDGSGGKPSVQSDAASTATTDDHDSLAGKLATQSDNISAPAPGNLPRSVAIPSTNWPATSSGLTEDYTGAFDPALAQVWSMPSFDFDFSDAAGATNFDFNQIFTPFEFGAVGFDANLPIAPAPVQGTMSSIADTPFSVDFDFSWLTSTQDAQFPMTATLSPAPSLPINNYNNYLPLLPPPPPESPERTEEAFSVASSSKSIAPRSRGRREPEVDVRNILPATSARSRVPTARKRGAEADDEASRSKRTRKPVSADILARPGVLSWHVSVDGHEAGVDEGDNFEVNRVAKERGYKSRDVIN
ncbi:hypothetical protein C8R45DRAFT_1220718 [Mycena sanguinolenta]|nr:hypothetical protein C8R45DRAFT_1220718 [Mycena sanguinolenta]